MAETYAETGTLYPKAGKGLKWTERELKAIGPALKGRILSDGEGLSGEVRAADDGSISVRFRYAFRWDKQVKWYQCGTWPLVALKDVRARRDEARQHVKDGINPSERKVADRIEAAQEAQTIIAAAAQRKAEDATLREMFDAWLEDGVKRADGNAEISRAFEKDVLPLHGTKPVRLVTEDDLRGLLKAIVARGANRMAVTVSNDIKQMFKWAEKRKPWRPLLQEGNPADLIEIEKIVSVDYDMSDERERVLSPAEIRELHDIFSCMGKAYEEAPPGKKYSFPRPLLKTSQLALWICLSTLSRIGETLKAEWVHVDLEARTWFIPKANVKGAKGKKQDQLVRLSDFALRQFQALHALTGKGKWLFPATQSNGHVNVKSVTKQVGDRQERFKNRVGPMKGRRQDNTLVLANGENGDWTSHDMRRTGATMMQRLGVQDHIIDRCQNHVIKASKVQKSYMHYDYADEKRESWRRLGERLDAILEEVPAAPPPTPRAQACPPQKCHPARQGSHR